MQSSKLTATWPRETPRPSPTALPRILTIPKPNLYSNTTLKINLRTTAQLKYSKVWKIKILMAIPSNQNNN